MFLDLYLFNLLAIIHSSWFLFDQPNKHSKLNRPSIWCLPKVQVQFNENGIMSSCVRPLVKSSTSPVVLLHGFDRFIDVQNKPFVMAYNVAWCMFETLSIIQLLSRMEIHLSIAWRGWTRNLGYWHSWLGFLWFRFLLLLLFEFGLPTETDYTLKCFAF